MYEPDKIIYRKCPLILESIKLCDRVTLCIQVIVIEQNWKKIWKPVVVHMS